MIQHQDMDLDAVEGKWDEDGVIQLTQEDKRRLYLPWYTSVIVKAFGKKLPYIYLKNKLQDLWKLSEPLTLIDLGNEYHVAKLNAEANKNKILHEGPWFVAGNFVSVKQYEPNFVSHSATITHMTIWARLPSLPIELYDSQILERVGKSLGTLLKVDACTSATLRRRYAHICVQVPIKCQLWHEVTIGSHRQKIVYEGDGILCTKCGKIVHGNGSCPTDPQNNYSKNKRMNNRRQQWIP